MLEQAVMVKHLTAGVRQASFERVDISARGRRKAAANLPMVKVSAEGATGQQAYTVVSDSPKRV